MMDHRILALILTLSNCIAFTSCKCYFYTTLHSKTLYCSNINLNEVIQFNREYKHSNQSIQLLQTLDIEKSNITEIYDNAFEGFNFENFILSNISLHKINPNVFVNFVNISQLILSSNELTTMDFHVPLNIKFFNISHNKICHIKQLVKYKNLVTLDLSYNLISSIEKFGPFNALNYLDLSHNNLSSLENITWTKGQMLNSLILSHNNLEYIPETIIVKHLDVSNNNISTFDCANITESINLSHNKFTEICNFSKTIKTIDFSYNAISHIDEQVFKILSKLEFLNLSRNYIETIHDSSFHDLINLKYLYLNQNFLSELPKGLFYHLENLKTLYIAMNNIEQFEPGTFTGLNKLEILNVSDNKIDNLDAIYSLKYLQELNIIDNYFIKLDVDQIAKHLQHLSKINFNMLYDVPCEELMVYLLEFKVNGITVEKGEYMYQDNVNGMYCYSEPNFISNKNESDKRRMAYIANYLSGINVALIVILVVLVFVIILVSFTLYRVYKKHRIQSEINLHTCSLKLLNENDPLN